MSFTKNPTETLIVDADSYKLGLNALDTVNELQEQLEIMRLEKEAAVSALESAALAQNTNTTVSVALPPTLPPTPQYPAYLKPFANILSDFETHSTRTSFIFPTSQGATMAYGRAAELNSTLTAYILDLIRQDICLAHPDDNQFTLRYLPEVGYSRRRAAEARKLNTVAGTTKAHITAKNAKTPTLADVGIKFHNSHVMEVVFYPDYEAIKKLHGYFPIGVWRTITNEEAHKYPQNTCYIDAVGNIYDHDFAIYRGEGFCDPLNKDNWKMIMDYRIAVSKTLPYERDSPFWLLTHFTRKWYQEQFEQKAQVEPQNIDMEGGAVNVEGVVQ